MGLELSEDAVSGSKGAVSDDDSGVVIGSDVDSDVESDVESDVSGGEETGAGSGWGWAAACC